MGTATKRAVKREAKRQKLAFSTQPEARIARLKLADSWTRRGDNEGQMYNEAHAKAVHNGLDRSTLRSGRNAAHIRVSF